MKVKFYCDSGANIYSCREEEFDLEQDLGISDEDWNNMDDEDRHKEVMIWAWEHLEVGYEEL